MKSSDGINILVQIYLLVNMYTHFWWVHTYKWDCWLIGCIYAHILPNNMFSKVDSPTYISPSTGWEFLLFLDCIKTWNYQSFTFWSLWWICIVISLWLLLLFFISFHWDIIYINCVPFKICNLMSFDKCIFLNSYCSNEGIKHYIILESYTHLQLTFSPY